MIRAVIILYSTFAVTFCKVVVTEVTTTVEGVEQEKSTEEFTTPEYPTTFSDFGNHSESLGILGDNASDIIQRSRRSGDNGCLNGWFNAIIEQYPFIVALYDKAGKYFCVGTTLTPRLILTANHCISPEWQRPYSIRAGSADNKYGGEKVWVQSVIRYPGADADSGMPTPHDIGLVLLQTRINSPSIVPLVGSQGKVYEGGIVLAVGWGRTRYQVDPRRLHATALQICPRSKCEKEYQTNDWLCTETSKTSTCEGDSGGPVMYNGQQVGIVSHSNAQQCGSGLPTANVNVKKYLGWIQQNVKMYN